MFCKNCGASLEENAAFCSNCGVAVETAAAPQQPVAPVQPAAPADAKSKLVAGLLGIFLGSLGIHNFYLGYTGKAVAQLLITLLTCGLGASVSSIWGLIEGILILVGNIKEDANGNPLAE